MADTLHPADQCLFCREEQEFREQYLTKEEDDR